MRPVLLGDIVNSPLVLAAPSDQTAADLSGDTSYSTYLATKAANMHAGLVVNAKASLAHGGAERDTALAMLGELAPAPNRTVGADKAYDTADFVAAARALGVYPARGAEPQATGGARPSMRAPPGILDTS